MEDQKTEQKAEKTKKTLTNKQKIIGLVVIIVLIAAAAGTFVFLNLPKPQTAWITDIQAAKTASQKTKKDLLVVFTGSDSNDQSKELISKVFTGDFFKKGSKKFVLCNIDIVQDEKLMDKTVLDANYKIITEYGVQNLPTFVLQTSEGDVYASSSSTDKTGTIDGFFAFLDTFKDARKNIVTMKNRIRTTKGAEKAKAIDKFIEAIDPSRREKYSEMIRLVPDLATGDAADLKGKYQLQVAYLDAITLYQNSKMVEAGDIFLKLAEGGTLNPAQSQEAWYMGAYMNAMSGKTDNAKILEWLQKAIDSDPKNPGATQIQATIEQIKSTPAKKTATAAPTTKK